MLGDLGGLHFPERDHHRSSAVAGTHPEGTEATTCGLSGRAGVVLLQPWIQAMERHFTRIANWVAFHAGRPQIFLACCLVIVVWAAAGPVFGFSDTWQLITIVTFLMVFLIQNTQNRDGAALQAKLDELIRVSEAQNRFIGIEHLTETELEEVRAKCEKAAQKAASRLERS